MDVSINLNGEEGVDGSRQVISMLAGGDEIIILRFYKSKSPSKTKRDRVDQYQ